MHVQDAHVQSPAAFHQQSDLARQLARAVYADNAIYARAALLYMHMQFKAACVRFMRASVQGRVSVAARLQVITKTLSCCGSSINVDGSKSNLQAYALAVPACAKTYCIPCSTKFGTLNNQATTQLGFYAAAFCGLGFAITPATHATIRRSNQTRCTDC